MEKYEKEFYSCYCLFDVCCLSQAKEGNFSKLGEKIKSFMRRRSDKILESGRCNCAYYYPVRFSDDNVWIVREIYHLQQKIIAYAVCREFYSERLWNTFSEGVPEQKMNLLCYKKDLYPTETFAKYPSCYNFFLAGYLIPRCFVEVARSFYVL